MSDRHAEIVRLLDTRFDNLPVPSRRDHGASGFVHRAPARESCPDCLANDRAMFGCETCGGRGYLEVVRERDPYAVDKVAPYGLDGSTHERARERDRQIAVLGEQTRPPYVSEADAIADANAHPYGWEIARRRMYAEFDYAALDRALEQLHQAHPDLSPRSRAGLAFLEARMPDPIRAPADVAPPRTVGKLGRGAGDQARELRDRQIRVWAEARKPYAWIREQTGLSDRQLREIINRKGRAA